jgi:hypothetical protein
MTVLSEMDFAGRIRPATRGSNTHAAAVQKNFDVVPAGSPQTAAAVANGVVTFCQTG